MIVALDTDVLVAWAMSGAPRHASARRFVAAQISQGNQIGLVSQVVFEFLHVSTDAKRFENPFSMTQALGFMELLREATEVENLFPKAGVVARTVQLLAQLKLGRKRILDTALAATLEAWGVFRLATFNAPDFQAFPFLEISVP